MLFHTRFRKIIFVTDPEIMRYVVQYVNKVVHLDRFIYKDNTYYKDDYKWVTYRIQDMREENGYHLCTPDRVINVDYHENVRYKYIFDRSEKNVLTKRDHLYNKFVKQILPYDLKEVLLAGFDSINFVNNFNTSDNVDHCGFKLPVYVSWEISKHVSLLSIGHLFGKYRLRKWDKCDVRTEIKTNGKCFNVSVQFNYDV